MGLKLTAMLEPSDYCYSISIEGIELAMAYPVVGQPQHFHHILMALALGYKVLTIHQHKKTWKRSHLYHHLR
jgi:hypothetical protein